MHPWDLELSVNQKHLKLLQKAQVLDLAGNAPKAAAAYRDFLKKAPMHAAAWADYGGQLLKLGNLKEALKACETAVSVDPGLLSARINLGSVLMQRGHLDDAEIQFRTALEIDPGRVDAQLFLAVCLLDKKDLSEAWRVLEATNKSSSLDGDYSELGPQFAELWAKLGEALFETQQFETSEEACHQALRIEPSNLTAQAYLGSVRMALGDLQGAAGLFRQLVADHPHEIRARLLLITCLARTGDPSLTCSEIAKALLQAPRSFLVHRSVMGPYYSLGCWAEYRAEIERFRKVEPGLAYLDYEQSFVDLLFGDLLHGWERFEARLDVPDSLRPQKTLQEPAWRGEAFAGKTLLLWAEQGLGDTLMCLRYLPMVKALGGRILLEAQAAVLEVASTCQGLDGVIPEGELRPPFDLQASILSLPRIFRTELSTIPDTVPYVRVPADVPHRRDLQELLAPVRECTRIGLVWAGNPAHARDHERSIPASALAPLAALPGVAWFSLQLGTQELPPLPDLVSLAPFLGDFADTAYSLSKLDLLISVDTSVAHLAGAMGVPTLLLLTHQPDYRWMLNRDDSPWYPTLRLYRQPRYGDWEAVLHQVVADLTRK